MTTLLAFSALLLILAIGDIASIKSKALLSSLFIFALVLIVAYWFGLPQDIIPTAGVVAIAPIVCGLHLVNLGTTISIPQFIKEWKTVVIGFACVLAIGLLGIFVLPLFMDKACALAGTPVLAGGVAAMLMVAEPLQAAGLAEPEIFSLLVCVLQFLVGIPIASILVRKDAQDVLASGKLMNIHQSGGEVVKERKKLIPALPVEYQSSSLLLFKAGIIATLSYWLSGLTGGNINSLLLCMIMGIVFTELGFLETDILKKANSLGFVGAYICIYIFSNANQATPAMIMNLLVPLIIMFAAGIIVLALVAILMSKIMKESFKMCFAIGLTCMFGYPATLYISNEVCSVVATNEEERQALDAYLRPKLIIAGFATLTVGSVILATFIIPMLSATVGV